MITRYQIFDLFVICLVVLVGGVFGGITGGVYGEQYWIAGVVPGLLCSFFLAKSYLRLLARMTEKSFSKKVLLLAGSLAGALYGIVCTAVVHVLMIAIFGYSRDFPAVFEIGILVGAGAGLVAGGICSMLYVSLEKGNANENA